MTPLSPRAKLRRLAQVAENLEADRSAVWVAAVTLAGMPADHVATLDGADDDAVLFATQRAATDRSTAEAAVRLWVHALATPVQVLALGMLAEGPCLVSTETAPERRTVAARTIGALQRRGLVHRSRNEAELSDLARRAACELPVRPPARNEHATIACYMLDQCRCLPCRVAGSGYERRRARQQQRGHARTVPADPVRRHVRSLMRSGVGLKQIAKVAGVGQATVAKLLYGTPSEGRPPSRRVQRTTAAALLAVAPEDRAEGTRVDAGPTLALVDELVSGGWTKAAIGRAIHGPSATSLQIARGPGGRVTVATERKVARLHAAWRASRVRPDGPALAIARAAQDADRASQCIDCGGIPLPGGAIRCLPCFQTWCRTRSQAS